MDATFRVEITHTFTVSDPLTSEHIKTFIDTALELRPYAGHLRVSPATYTAIRNLAVEPPHAARYPSHWLNAVHAVPLLTGVNVVVDHDVPDTEIRVGRMNITYNPVSDR